MSSCRKPRSHPANVLISSVRDVLVGEGFVQRHRSLSGSVYLTLPPESFLLRLAHHALPRRFCTWDRRDIALSVRLIPSSGEARALAMGIAWRYLAACGKKERRRQRPVDAGPADTRF
jgi:hypothetical protein